MKNLSKVSTPKKVFFIGLGILALGIVIFTIGLQQSHALWQTFHCRYDLGLNNSNLTKDQGMDKDKAVKACTKFIRTLMMRKKNTTNPFWA